MLPQPLVLLNPQVTVPNPDIKGRTEILELYLEGKPISRDVDVHTLARGTVGFSGADLANLVNVAAVKAAVDGTEVIGTEQLEYAKDKIMMGAERKSAVLSEESRKVRTGRSAKQQNRESIKELLSLLLLSPDDYLQGGGFVVDMVISRYCCSGQWMSVSICRRTSASSACLVRRHICGIVSVLRLAPQLLMCMVERAWLERRALPSFKSILNFIGAG